MLDYKLIEALACVIQEAGFDKASRVLNITQSAVSQRIKQLEDQMGQILVTRTSPPCATDTGRNLLKHYMQVKHLEGDLLEPVREGDDAFHTLAMGINADSLATWFYPSIEGFIHDNRILLDLKVDDQDETHLMLKRGEVAGCISSEKSAVQGCRAAFLGAMTYRFCATPAFTAQYFPHGVDADSLEKAPVVIFNRKDDLQDQFAHLRYNRRMSLSNIHYVPSSEIFARMIITGAACGMIPDLQSLSQVRSGDLLDLAPEHHIRVDLYWHRWNLDSLLLDQFSRAMIQHANIY